VTTLQKTTVVIFGLLATAQLLHAEERTDPSLALPFQSKALHTEYRDNLSDEEKLAGLSLVWSEAKYNFANFDLVPQLDWDARYMAFVPRVLATADTAGYYGELQRFIAGLNDGHSNVTPPSDIRTRMSRPPVYTRLIGNEVVIYLIDSLKLLDDGLAVGQVIREIDGVETMEYAARRVTPFVASSTQQDREVRSFNFELLRGPKDTPVELTVEELDGGTRKITVPRSGYSDEDDAVPFPGSFSWRWAADGVALIDARSFNDKEHLEAFREALPELMKAEAWIFDIRLNGGGNSGVGFGMLEHITDQEFLVFAWRTRIYRPTLRAWQRDTAWAWHDAGAETWESEAQPKFDGRVAVLTSARTYSAAEDFAIAFRQLDRGPIVGQTTGGSTGQPLHQPLPGGGSFRICTKRDTAGDGTEWIGIGIAPDITVNPTRASISSGEDPVLQRAIAEITREPSR
jgi:C-terminal processing protease CtpA/Prc